MCLEVTASSSAPPHPGVNTKALSVASGLCITSQRRSDRSRQFHFASEPGCSCSLLLAGAAIDADIWLLKPEHLEGLALAIESIAASTTDLSFVARYLGKERREGSRLVSVAELVDIIRSNRLENNVVYSLGLPNNALQRTRFARR